MSKINLDESQQRAFDRVAAWLKNPDKYMFSLQGGAGTGKSTLVAALEHLFPGSVEYIAPTGKAAQVLRQKEIPAKTAHSMLYKPVTNSEAAQEVQKLMKKMESLDPDSKEYENANEILLRMTAERNKVTDATWSMDKWNSPLAVPPQLIIIDESSMIRNKQWSDMRILGSQLLAVGDPYQLPPVNDEPDPLGRKFFNDVEADVLLETIHRQALDSPIIQASIEARMYGGFAERINTNGCIIAARPQFSGIVMASLDYERVIVHANQTRKMLNTMIRIKKGLDPYRPGVGETIMIRNKYSGIMKKTIDGDICEMPYEFTKGSEYEVLSIEDQAGRDRTNEPFVKMLLKDWEGNVIEVSRVPTMAFRGYFTTAGVKDIQHAAGIPFHLNSSRGLIFEQFTRTPEFDFCHAITCHNAQGSQWDNVMVIADYSGKDKKKWLYTAVTRAAKNLLVYA